MAKTTDWHVDRGEVEPFLHRHALENCWAEPTQADLHLTYDPAIPLLSIYPKEMSAQVHERRVHECTQ